MLQNRFASVTVSFFTRNFSLAYGILHATSDVDHFITWISQVSRHNFWERSKDLWSNSLPEDISSEFSDNNSKSLMKQYQYTIHATGRRVTI